MTTRWEVVEVRQVRAGWWEASVLRRDQAGHVSETAIFEDYTANGAIRSRDRFLAATRDDDGSSPNHYEGDPG